MENDEKNKESIIDPVSLILGIFGIFTYVFIAIKLKCLY